MKEYFECNLPREIPVYYTAEIRQKLQDCVDRVYKRTAVLNAACKAMQARGMEPATFHALAKQVFDLTVERFDNMTPEQLCTLVTLTDTGKKYPERVEWPNVDVFYDTAFVTTADWESLRHFGIGGSDSAVVMGVSPYTTLEGLWYDKTGYPELVKDEGRQAIFDRGHFLEPAVIQAFCDITGAVQIPESRMFRSRKHPTSTANIDAILRMPSGKIALFEAKSAVDCYNKIQGWLGDSVPPYYVTQTHQYIGVMDDDRIEGEFIGMLPCTDHTLAGRYIGSEYDPKKYFHHFIEKDEATEESILQAEEDFWNNYVLTGIKPEPSKNAEVDKDVAKRFRPSPMSEPDAPKTTIDYESCETLVKQLQKVDADISTQKSKMDSLTNYRDTLRNQLIDKMGAAQEADMVAPDGHPVYTVKNTLIEKASVDMTTLKQFFPEAAEKCVKTSSFTRFSIKEAKPPKEKKDRKQ